MDIVRHYSINSKQLDILKLLYQFRFGTTQLIAQALGVKTQNKMNERLKVLLDQEYIGRNYEPEYRLLRKHATYYLRPKGIKALKELYDKHDEVVLHNIYKDRTASELFINHSLMIFKAYCELRYVYGKELRFFTKSQLRQYDYFPQPLPDAYVRIEATPNDDHYFLDILQSSRPFFISSRKPRHYSDYADKGEWEDTGTTLPKVILVCDSSQLKRRLDKLLLKYDNLSQEMQIKTTLQLAATIELELKYSKE